MKTSRGLSKELVLEISKQKKEPKWVLDLRLKGLELWDKLEMPIFNTNLVNLYGKPIYVSEDDDIKEKLKELQESLELLDKKIIEAYDEVYQWGLWKKKRSESSQFKWNP